MSAAAPGIVPAQLVSVCLDWSCLPSCARFTGFLIALIGDAIFLIAVLCMKDSWRAGIPEKDKTELVTGEIYAFCRNPAFLGFDLMYIGVQIPQEERYMASIFGEEYLSYKKRVFRYLGRR